MEATIVKMFELTRVEYLEMLEAKLASALKLREKVDAECGANIDIGAGPRAGSIDKEVMKRAYEEIDYIEKDIRFMIAHVAPEPSWRMGREQLREILTSCELLEIDTSKLRFAIEPGKAIVQATYNFNGRKARY